MKENFLLNPNNVRIKKCCASCAHKEIGKSEDQRICMHGEGEVPKDYLCSDWELSENCKKLKMEQRGAVKKPHYIAWQKAELGRIAESAMNTNERNLAIRTLAERYESAFGTRYM